MNQSENKLEQPLQGLNNMLSNSQGKQCLQEGSAEVFKSGLAQKLENRAEFDGAENFQLKNIEEIENQDKGSNNLGKFKNSDSLLQSYNSLQSDYTKKCQALKELQKQVEDEKFLKEQEQKNREEFEKMSNQFFDKNPKAKKYEQELTNLVLKDKDLASAKSPFESAWVKFSSNNLFGADELASDENFLKNYIFNNDKIKSQIIAEYFSGLKINNSPILISNQKGSKTISSPVSKPKTIGEAGKLAEELFD